MPKRIARYPSPTSLSVPFVRVSIGEIADMHKKGLPTKWAVYLLYHTHVGEVDGTVWVSESRRAIADVLGVGEASVSNAAHALKEQGLLKTLIAGHNGVASVYSVQVGIAPEQVPTEVGIASGQVPTSDGTAPEQVPTLPENSRGRVGYGLSSSTKIEVGTAPEQVPIRTFKEGSYVDPSCVEELKPTRRAPREFRPIYASDASE